MSKARTLLAALLLAAALPAASAASEAEAPAQAMVEAIVAWNAALLEVAEAEDGFLTLKGVRTAALMHLAMHDVLASVHGGYTPFAYERRHADVDATTALNHAAYAVAAGAYPGEAERFAALRDRWFAAGLDGKAARGAERLGEAAAEAALAAREGDGWDGEAEYEWHPMAPGVYAEFNEHSGTPEGFVFGAGWANARGFALETPDQFRSPPPPAIDSDDYVGAYREVKDVGRFQSIDRTPDQTHLALWWKDFVENSHNRLARDLVVRERVPALAANRLFALLNMSVFDAYVSSFDNKFFYNHWRPYTAIRWAEHDGNGSTEPEESWENTHRHTYAFPSYPSAHGTACAAAMSAFENTFGADYAFTMRTPEVDIAGPFSGKIRMQPATRSFDGFMQAANECALSRVYLGIHFRYDSTEGYRLGRKVGANVLERRLTRSR